MTSEKPGPREALAAALAFEIPGRPFQATPLGSGHINDTFLLVSATNRGSSHHVLQRINTRVFTEPAKLMENIERVTAHIKEKLAGQEVSDPSRRALELVATRNGKSFAFDERGWAWRVFKEIPAAKSWDTGTSSFHVREAARAFARFSTQLADLPGSPLHETIPRFHDTPARFSALVAALERDPVNRAGEVRPEAEDFLKRESLSCALTGCLKDGRLETRVVHNDTKVNNVLMDETTGEGLCVIDLDTVMPGLFLTDFGDLTRSAANPFRESGPRRAVIDETLFQAAVSGTIDVLGTTLAPLERSLLVTATAVLTLELGLRFLTDHLLGDSYFKVSRHGENLDRARVQLSLLRSIEEKRERLERIVERVARGTLAGLPSERMRLARG